jgi:hypothetical protein
MTKEKMPKGQIMTYMYQTLQTTADWATQHNRKTGWIRILS